MTNLQNILGLFIVLVIALSMGLQFSNSKFSKEGFHNKYYTGSDLDYVPTINIPNGDKSGNLRYPGLKYLGVANDPRANNSESIAKHSIFDDTPAY
jgi:hypothetical protein